MWVRLRKPILLNRDWNRQTAAGDDFCLWAVISWDISNDDFNLEARKRLWIPGGCCFVDPDLPYK